MTDIKVVDAIPEGATVMCLRTGMVTDVPAAFADNVTGACAECGHGIVHRPSLPKGVRKVCVMCVADMAASGEDMEFGLTVASIRETLKAHGHDN